MENKASKLALLSLGINAILLILVVILFKKMPASSERSNVEVCDTCESVLPPDDGVLTIGYFNTDSLNSKLLFVKELEDQMMQSQKNAESKMIKKQNEIEAWKKKWEGRGQLLPSEEEQYMIEAQKMQNDAMNFEQQVQMDLMQEQEALMMTHVLRVSKFSKEYGVANGYDLILSYQLGQNLVYVSPRMDVTNELVKLINEDYENNSNGGADTENEEAGN